LDELEALLCKKAAEDPDGVSADVDTILAATEKVLAVNRGTAEPDERDSLEFRKIHMPAELMAERIAMDSGKVRRTLMRRVAKARSLKPVGVAAFDSYIEGSLYGNPLCLPLEEINTNHLVEQSRRISGMGLGGLSSDDSISSEAQALHPSTFGFLSAIEGPESGRIGIDTRLAINAKIGDDGKIYKQMLHKPSGKKKWVSASDLHNSVVGLPE
jgi:DNA-directed RNA polymerase beta subunit